MCSSAFLSPFSSSNPLPVKQRGKRSTSPRRSPLSHSRMPRVTFVLHSIPRSPVVCRLHVVAGVHWRLRKHADKRCRWSLEALLKERNNEANPYLLEGCHWQDRASVVIIVVVPLRGRTQSPSHGPRKNNLPRSARVYRRITPSTKRGKIARMKTTALTNFKKRSSPRNCARCNCGTDSGAAFLFSLLAGITSRWKSSPPR